jgi:hypothetical protein
VNIVFALIIVAVASLACLPAPALAQPADDSGSGAQPSMGGSMGHHGHRNRQQDAAPGQAPRISEPTLHPDPRQRLDVGALVCDTEAELRQHQTAIMARIAGHDAPEPAGCRLVQEMVAVSVVDRHGPARTQVRLRGQAEQVGWTDAVIRDEQTGAQ